MVFLSNKIEAKSYTHIHNIFFEQILPYIDSKYLKIYMYSYYLASNIESIGAKSNEDIALSLNIDITEVLSAFDYLEKCNLIRKHYIENSSSDNYSIEFLPVNQYKQSQDISYEQEYLSNKNENLRSMYDKIEEIIKTHLNANDIRKIDTVIKNNDLAYDVVIEAFKFVYYNKKSANIIEVVNTLKSWIADGISTSNDLENNLFNINERYATYRKILKYFGEYRLPTKPEIKTMNKWLDEYCFSIEVIEKAIDETLKIKSPNFKYLDKVLDNWYNSYTENKNKNKANDMQYHVFKGQILDFLQISRIDTNNEKMLSFLYKNYPLSTILSAIKYLSKTTKISNISIEHIFDFITSSANKSNINDETVVSFGNITIDDMKDIFVQNKKIIQEKIKEKQTNRTTSYVQTPSLTGDELEKFILSKNDLDEF